MRSKIDENAWIPTWAEQIEGLSRVSGLPVGLPELLWPSCGLCGRSLSFIGQVEHGIGALNLGGKGKVLYVFLCRNFDSDFGCEAYVGVLGNHHNTHKIIIHHPAYNTETHTPADLAPWESGLVAKSWKKTTESCAQIALNHLLFGLDNKNRTDWPAGYSWSRYVKETAHNFKTTKIGGIPSWIQEPWFNCSGAGRSEWKYIMQFSDSNLCNQDIRWSTLESGILYLLQNNVGEFELYYQGR